MAKKKEVRTDREIADTFEQDDYDIPNCLEYFMGVDGFSVGMVNHPDHLWTILDRIHSDLMEGERFDVDMTKEQREWLQEWIYKWMKEIEPYCVRLEPE